MFHYYYHKKVIYINILIYCIFYLTYRLFYIIYILKQIELYKKY